MIQQWRGLECRFCQRNLPTNLTSGCASIEIKFWRIILGKVWFGYFRCEIVDLKHGYKYRDSDSIFNLCFTFLASLCSTHHEDFHSYFFRNSFTIFRYVTLTDHIYFLWDRSEYRACTYHRNYLHPSDTCNNIVTSSTLSSWSKTSLTGHLLSLT